MSNVRILVGNALDRLRALPDLALIPHRTAIALCDAGWWLRADVVWAKIACMPESVEDRPTRSHESVFLLAKSERYFYDHKAVREPAVMRQPKQSWPTAARDEVGIDSPDGMRNLRDVWTLGPEPYKGAHSAVMPTRLAELCIKASCPAGGVVLDPFGGAGTTGLVAARLWRDAVLIELNPAYAEIARARIADDLSLLTSVELVEAVVA